MRPDEPAPADSPAEADQPGGTSEEPSSAGEAVPALPRLSAQERSAQARRTLTRLLRLGYLVFFFVVLLVYALEEIRSGDPGVIPAPWWVLVLGGITLAVVFVAIDVLTPQKRLALIVGVFFGLLAGLLATWALFQVFDLFITLYELGRTPEAQRVILAMRILIGISVCYLAVSVVLQTQDDFRLVVPYIEFAKQIRGPKPILLDSSALIDGRIADLAGVGAVQVPLVIPRFVVDELQLMGDRGDRMQRARSRRGLETISRLQRLGGADVSIDETPVPGKAVDQMLVELARMMPATIATTDAGLARVAGIAGVGVMNLNEVANALKPSLLPGSRLTLTLVKPGEHAGQGVGYLDDGTMVVVDGGAGAIGREVKIEITSSMQTAAGRLLFARPLEASPEAAPAAPDSPLQPPSPPAPQDHAQRPEPAAAGITPPRRVAPPAPPTPTDPPSPGPLGPTPGTAGRRVPNRNPRR
jgi:uncharacterized protein YacL